MRHIAISDPVLDLRAVEQVLMRRVAQEVEMIRALPMACGSWQREKAAARKDAFDTALMDIRFAIESHRRQA